MENRTLLSVLSHVAHGYVGNRATTFPLQYYGWDVDTIHTTDFSNHPGYGKLTGTKSSPEHVAELFRGLKEITDFRSMYRVIIVGYCPSAEVMLTIYKEITPALRREDKNENSGGLRPVLVVDPVLGDNGRLYVPAEVVPVHVDFLKLGLVSLTTPNQFEIELLTETKIHDWESAKNALLKFHERYHVPNVVILSVVINNEMFSVGFCHSMESTKMFRLPIDQIGCAFNGCGDVFTGLLTHEFYQNNCVLLPHVLGTVLARLSRILKYSYEDEKRKTGETPKVVRDVRLIQLRDVFDEKFNEEWKVEFL